MIVPVWPAPLPALLRDHMIQGKYRATNVFRMDMSEGRSRFVRLIHHARADVMHASSGLGQIINLQNHHVTAVPAALLEKSSRRGCGRVRRDHLEESSTYWED